MERMKVKTEIANESQDALKELESHFLILSITR